jgi:valyl-tRNA synthetase
VWQSLPGVPEGAALIRQPYPEPIPALADAEAEMKLAAVMEVCRVARNLKAELSVPSKTVELHVTGSDELHAPYVEAMARVRVRRDAATGPTARALAGSYDLAISREGLVDPAVEQARVQKDLEAARKELAGLEARLENPQFAERAPAAVVEKARAQQSELRERIAKLEERQSG